MARVAEATLVRYLGTYRNGSEAIVIARAGDILTATRGGGGSGPLRLIGLGTFTDAAGTSYLFDSTKGDRLTTLAPDGTRRQWTR